MQAHGVDIPAEDPEPPPRDLSYQEAIADLDSQCGSLETLISKAAGPPDPRLVDLLAETKATREKVRADNAALPLAPRNPSARLETLAKTERTAKAAADKLRVAIADKLAKRERLLEAFRTDLDELEGKFQTALDKQLQAKDALEAELAERAKAAVAEPPAPPKPPEPVRITLVQPEPSPLLGPWTCCASWRTPNVWRSGSRPLSASANMRAAVGAQTPSPSSRPSSLPGGPATRMSRTLASSSFPSSRTGMVLEPQP